MAHPVAAESSESIANLAVDLVNINISQTLPTSNTPLKSALAATSSTVTAAPVTPNKPVDSAVNKPLSAVQKGWVASKAAAPKTPPNKIPAAVKSAEKKVEGTPKVVKKKKNGTIARATPEENTTPEPAADNSKGSATS